MPDAVTSWGACPVLQVGPLAVPAYGALVLLGLLAGGLAVWASARRQGYRGEQAGLLLGAAVVGGTLGAKIPVWVMHFHQIVADPGPMAIFSGRTVVGGLIGGALAVILVRRWLGLRARSGNIFAPGMALGLAIGRLGCFCGGCCHGVAAALPWSVDFGDGIPRHPTQLYEAFFAAGLFVWLKVREGRQPAPGALFRAFMLAYFSFRFLVEFLRTDTPVWHGLTLAQLVSLGVVGYYLLAGRQFTHPDPSPEEHPDGRPTPV